MLKRKLTQVTFVRYFFARKNLKVFFLFSILFLVQISCNTTEPPIIPPPPVVKDTITVDIESFTHRSITLNINSTANSKNSTVRLIRELNGVLTTVTEYPIVVKDTTLTDDDNGVGLLLDTTYTYYAVRVDSLGQLKDTSNTVTQKTLAPTSHNYTWQEFTIGDWQSALYDVWGTDENNVWACGGVTINDSVHGLLHWDGVQWTPKGRGGGYAMFGFAADDIWTVGGSIFHYDGQNWNEVLDEDPILQSNIPYTSIWGTSSNNLYLGNASGKIIHWDGSKAEVMDITAEKAIGDIWGFSSNEIYATSGFVLNSYGELFRYDGIEWSTIRTGSYSLSNADTFGPFSSIWGYSSNELFLVADWIERKINNTWLYEYNVDSKMNRIRGSASNNVFVCAHFGVVVHYNGVDWMQYTLSSQVSLVGLQVFSNQVFIVGYDQNTAFIYRGLKQ